MNQYSRRQVVFALLFAASGLTSCGSGDTTSGTSWWAQNPDNVAICTAANNQIVPQIVPDGMGGAIIVWQDYRSGTNLDIYAQRVNSVGEVRWATDGVAINTAAGNLFDQQTKIISDGAGGAIIVWSDLRSGIDADIYAQRINNRGVVQWTTDGVAISKAIHHQFAPQIVPDGNGGAIIAWQDNRSSTGDIYAQRVSSAGTVQWAADGVAISTATNDQTVPQLIPDGTSGAIVVWQDSRYFGITGTDIYAQRVDGAGTVQWIADGVAISTATNSQEVPRIVTDGAGGAIIVWQDARSSTSWDIYAQRVSSVGTVQWTADGVAISAAVNNQMLPQIASDGAGGAIVAWTDWRSSGGTNIDIYAQRINSAGAAQWNADGVAISTAANNQIGPQIVPDSAGGAIIVWGDGRSGTNGDIYAQRVDNAGTVRWATDGVAISTAVNSQGLPQIASRGANGAVIVWPDDRSGTSADIYAQGITASGLQ